MRTFPYDVEGVNDLGHTLRAYTDWGWATVHLTDDTAYDEAAYIVLAGADNTQYTIPGFIARTRDGTDFPTVFHADASYVQLIPWAVLRDVKLVYP